MELAEILDIIGVNTFASPSEESDSIAAVSIMLWLLLPDPFREMGTWRKTMESQKPGNSPGPGPEVVERQRVAKERAAQRVCSWTVQNEMRGVLERVSAGTAERILDSANPREIRA